MKITINVKQMGYNLLQGILIYAPIFLAGEQSQKAHTGWMYGLLSIAFISSFFLPDRNFE